MTSSSGLPPGPCVGSTERSRETGRCRSPLGAECSWRDFEGVWTDAGRCWKLELEEELHTAGPDYTLDLILDTATYEAIPTFPTSGLRVQPLHFPAPPCPHSFPAWGLQMVIHEPGSVAVISDAAFDVAAGSATLVGLSLEKTSSISREEHPCLMPGERQLEHLQGPALFPALPLLPPPPYSAHCRALHVRPLRHGGQAGGEGRGVRLLGAHARPVRRRQRLRPPRLLPVPQEGPGCQRSLHYSPPLTGYPLSVAGNESDCIPACVYVNYVKDFSYQLFRFILPVPPNSSNGHVTAMT